MPKKSADKIYFSIDPITCFEDLSTEVLYEIFEFLEFYHIYPTFSKLSIRYYNLVNHSTLPIKINLSSVSKSIYECHYKDILTRNHHRINSIHITNPFIYNLSSSPLHILSQLSRIETLILENIPPENLENLLHRLSSLPNLSALTTVPIGYVQNKNILYQDILHLPVLKYCKLSLKQRDPTGLLQLNLNQPSPIQHFILDSNYYINSLHDLLSHLPQLRRLSCTNLFGPSNLQIQMRPIVLHNLTSLSLKIENSNFDQIELFLTNLVHQLRVFHFSTEFDIAYVNANRWQRLILSRMSKLRTFDIELQPRHNPHQHVFHISINQFTSSFWLERRWFFGYEYENSIATFYSIKPHRKQYTLHNCLYQNPNGSNNKIDFHSIDHLSIRGNLESKNQNFFSFPSVTQLSIFDHFNDSLYSISSLLDRIIPSTKLYKLSILCQSFCVTQFIELLYFSPNIHILIINFISFSKINCKSIQQTQTFRTVFNENKIINITLKEHVTSDILQLFVKLCPRLELLTINTTSYNMLAIVQTVFLENFIYSPHLCFLCFLNANEMLSKMLISYLPSDCLIKFSWPNLYVWW